ncbi:protein kinase [Nocardioides sp. WL0053]|uniref:non-specific serine/threonine protein kinase n=1 Tax=Nocardioides jiangsuensis TaxID=2866161 RepID=A0ABS7RGQ8_9ACTN|nr:Stk1 family PASTA domain-containing Ser/Thr kinase [Nocardioides jiangsuensis]MBY9074209.1 protein kinase [Nocardioides jiangsuensis]
MSQAGPEQQLGGRYHLDSRIATGGMGEVWRATDTLLDREVAVKVLKHEYADDPSFHARFAAEARHAASLHHVNVASVFDFGEVANGDGSGGSRPFLVMELVPGQPLSALLQGGEPMPPGNAADLVAQAADAIAAAHALGIVHRDVKPANLLVTPDGTVKITDFGIARASDGATMTQTGQIVGTPHYISPEQAEGYPATEASDVYALGVVLYECLAGHRPFVRDTPISVALAHVREPVPPLPSDVPERLRAVVDKALAKLPEDRFATAADLATALRGGAVTGFAGAIPTAAAAAGVPHADSTQVLERPEPVGTVARDETTERRESRRRPAWWLWASAAVAVLLLVLGINAVAREDDPAPAATQEPAAAADDEPAEATDGRVRLPESDYIGRPFGEVEKEIEEAGLSVQEQPVAAESAEDEKGTVAWLDPDGRVPPDATIYVGVYDAYQVPDEEDEVEEDLVQGDADKAEDKDHGKDGDKSHPGKAKGKH